MWQTEGQATWAKGAGAPSPAGDPEESSAGRPEPPSSLWFRRLHRRTSHFLPSAPMASATRPAPPSASRGRAPPVGSINVDSWTHERLRGRGRGGQEGARGLRG